MKNIKKWIAAVACLAMIAAIAAGCNQGPQNAAGSDKNLSATSSSPTSATPDKAAGPVTLTFGSAYKFQESPNWLEFPAVKKMMSDLNINISYTYYGSDKMGLMLASGDLPDIVAGDQPSLSEILKNKMALNLDPLLKDHAPNMLLDIYKTRNELLRTLMGGPEKALYFLAPGMGPEYADGGKAGVRGYNIRWDYYKEIGCPPIDNDADYLTALERIHKLHPLTANGEPVYGVGVYDDLLQWCARASFVKTCALNPWTIYGYQYMAGWADTELYDGYTDTSRSAYWTDMAFYHKVYGKGLLDPDSFTMKYDQYTAKVANGQYLSTPGYKLDDLYNAELKKDPNTLAGIVVVPSKGHVYFANMNHATGNAPTNYLFISAKSPNWEAALSLFNYISSPDNIRMFFSGIQDKDWHYDGNGIPVIADSTIQGRLNNTDDFQKSGIGGSGGLKSLLMPITPDFPASDGYAVDLFFDPHYRSLGLSALQQDFDKYYGADYPSQACMKLVGPDGALDMRDDYVQTVSSGINQIPDDIKRIMDKCNSIIYQAVPKLVMAKSDSEFTSAQENVMAQLKAANEETAWNWVRQAYNSSKAIIDQAMAAAK